MSHGADLENQLAEHQFIAAALRKCPDVVSSAAVVRVTRVKITEGEGLHTIEESHDLVHGAIVAFGDPEIIRSVYVFVDEAREEPMLMAHEYTRTKR